jgi:uncharacterized protein (TIGR02588 family)
MEKKSSALDDARRIPRSEWAVAIGGLVLVVGVIAYLIQVALTDKDTPPDITVTAVDVAPASGGYLVRIEAFNSGGQAAADVRIDATLRQDGAAIERRDLSFDFLPTRSKRRGGVVFRHNPDAFQMELSVVSHREP